MLKLLFKQKWSLLAILFFIIIDPAISSWLNFWLQDIFNYASTGASKLLIVRMITIGFIVWVTRRIINFTSDTVKNGIVCNVKQDLKRRLFVKVFFHDVSEVTNKLSSGEYISVFTNDILLIEQRFFNSIMALISSIASVIILSSSFLLLNFKIACAILIFGIVTMALPAVFAKKLSRDSLEYSEKVANFTQKIKEFFSFYPTIKNYAVEEQVLDLFHEINMDTEESKYKSECSLTLANSIGTMLSWFMQIIAIGIGLIMVVNGEILVGVVIAARSFSSDLAAPLQQIVWSINSIRSISKVVERIRSLEGEDVKQTSDSEHEELTTDELTNCIEYENVSIEFNGKKIVNNFSFKFEKGKKYLIIGKNGSGKSSLFKLLKKRFNSYEGSIKINNLNLNEIDNTQLSRHVSYLGESVSLFSGTINENVLLYRNLSEEAYNNAVIGARMTLDGSRVIVDGAHNVSSGEQRKIEIARSLINAVPIMVFDEVISTLDIETAYDIEKMVLDFEDKTVIFISHNFSGKLIKMYDEILLMEDGCLVAHGDYETLKATSEYFQRVCDIKFAV